MKTKKWNEEYFISFILNGKKFSTPNGRGYEFMYDVRQEVSRLKNKGAKEVKVGVRKWS